MSIRIHDFRSADNIARPVGPAQRIPVTIKSMVIGTDLQERLIVSRVPMEGLASMGQKAARFDRRRLDV
jgi:hypothetical protein